MGRAGRCSGAGAGDVEEEEEGRGGEAEEEGERGGGGGRAPSAAAAASSSAGAARLPDVGHVRTVAPFHALWLLFDAGIRLNGTARRSWALSRAE